MNKLFYRSVVVLVLAAMLAAFATPVLADAPAPDRKTAKFEIQFMKGMIDHHAAAIEMSRLCLERAIHDELRAMCETMIEDQQNEIETMQTWLQDWYDTNHRPQIAKQNRKMMMELNRYHGEEFEIRFMRMMIQHHQMAIEMSETCLQRAYHEPLLNLCGTIIATQMEEIQQLQTWLCEWYQRCGNDTDV